MDLATLGLEIRSDGVVVAKDRLQDFEHQASKTEKATSLLLKAFGLLGAVFSVSKLIEYTNVWTDLNSRIEIATGSMGRGAATMDRIAEMARRTYSPLEQTAEAFLGNATALRELGYSTSETLDYVEAINNALVVSGAKGQRAESVMNALNKSMGLGKLSGENLNTVLASGGRITEVLAESLGVTTNELRKLGADGKLTGDVIYEALVGSLEKLREEADGMPATIGDAFVLLNNSIIAAVGRFDEMAGASSRVAEAIIWVADAVADGTISIERMLAIAFAMGAYMAGAWVVSFIAANGAVGALTAGLTLLRGALIRTGIGALVVIAGELIYRLYDVVEGSESVGEAFDRLKASGLETLERVADAGRYLYLSMHGWAAKIDATFKRLWADMLTGFFNMLSQLGAAAGIAIPGLEALDHAATAAWDNATAANNRATTIMEYANTVGGRVFEDKSTSTGEVAETPDLGGGGGGGGGGAAAKADAYAKLTKSIYENIAALEVEAEALGLTEFQATKLSVAQELLRAAAEAGRPLTAELIEDINSLAYKYAEAEQVVAGVTLALSNPEPWAIMREELASLDIALARGKISLEQYNAAAVRSMAGAANATLGSMGQITGALASAFEGNKAFAIANAVINTAEGVTKALAQGGMFSFPIAAALAAAGAAQIATIMSASPGGGSSGSIRTPAAPTIQNAPQREKAEKTHDRMDITLHGLDRGSLYSGENIESFLRAIEERAADGRILNIKVA